MKVSVLSFAALLLVSACKGKDGAQGANGSQGVPGVQGQPGEAGATGAQGAAGQDGTVITVVKFCPGVSSYPSTFPEVGLCIDNEIYAVYSKNDGFLTKIVPGTYNSNAVGSSCTFTVLPNCQVQ